MALDTPWHALRLSEVQERLSTTANGLAPEEAARRREQFGPNRVTPGRRRTQIERLGAQFHNILIYVLLAAGLATAALGHWVDAGVILSVVVINAIIGFIQEGRAERALEAIQALLSEQAMVIRGGVRLTLPATDLVPGDVVVIQSGDKVPADLRLVRARGLKIQEAILTGESLPVDKATEPVAVDASLGDRFGMAFQGTLVGQGQGQGVVVETGDCTELGSIRRMLTEVTTLTTPLLRQLDKFGRWLTAAILILSAVTFLFGVFVRQFPLVDMFMVVVGIAVAAIPEGLPAIVTISLAIGVERMAKRNAIVRRLPAVEALGAVSVICSDKTGTFTRNEMTVQSIATSRQLFSVTGTGYLPAGDFLLSGAPVVLDEHKVLRQMLLGGLLCSNAALRQQEEQWVIDGDPMEGALIVAAAKAKLDAVSETRRMPRSDEIPFEAEHRFMATLHRDTQGHGTIYVKGAPEALLDMCDRQFGFDGAENLDRGYWNARLEEIAARGERVLALAISAATPDQKVLQFEDVRQGLTILGFFGLLDPPREEAIKAVAACRAAGIRVKMITGDHAGTARSIAVRLGLANASDVLTGGDLDGLDPETFSQRAEDVDVFARTSPAHKLRLVKVLQDRGHVVAMTGDGVNDAPALKRADVGVAMGRTGSDAAKEAAEMVLADDNFASIEAAVEEGRTVYDNIRKSILFILPTNGGEAFTVIAAILLGLTLPITPVQILWINMVTTVTLALALAFEPAEDNVMARAPRSPKENILSGYLIWRVAFVSAVMMMAIFSVFSWLEFHGADHAYARTAAVNTAVMCEALYLFNVRRLAGHAFIDILTRHAGPAWIAVGLVIGLQLTFIYLPVFQTVFHTRPLTGLHLATTVAVAGGVFLVVEIEKAFRDRAIALVRRVVLPMLDRKAIS